ncbi:uncharacterized protein LOC107978033 [Cricetulus griseus]|uniref:uncharacterized protein LOC107978033 n=1 Tax=Cricetulus griseus TaxID=10029 RepID=UPI0015C369EC|nr:uncharacterized protein LOC107978033 [Cricetulus griseus]
MNMLANPSEKDRDRGMENTTTSSRSVARTDCRGTGVPDVALEGLKCEQDLPVFTKTLYTHNLKEDFSIWADSSTRIYGLTKTPTPGGHGFSSQVAADGFNSSVECSSSLPSRGTPDFIYGPLLCSSMILYFSTELFLLKLRSMAIICNFCFIISWC